MPKKLPIVTFEQWLASPRGKKVYSAIISQAPIKNQKYIKNCLWWAYSAGRESRDIQPSEAGSILREVLNSKYYKSHNLKNRIEYLLKENCES